MIRAYLGGSFNPVHLSHLLMARRVYQALSPYERRVYLMPSRNPFKLAADNANANADHHRIAMLKLALEEYNRRHHCQLALCLAELGLAELGTHGDNPPTHHQPTHTPTYTIDTLQRLNTQYPHDTLIFIIGQDSLISLPHWRGGVDLLNYAHFWVFARGGLGSFEATLPPILKNYVMDLPTLLQHLHGGIYLDARPITPLSSTAIRAKLASGGDTNHQLLQTVAEYIHQNKLYKN